VVIGEPMSRIEEVVFLGKRLKSVVAESEIWERRGESHIIMSSVN